MRSLTDEEILELAESVGVTVAEDQLETVRSCVNENLGGLEGIDDIERDRPALLTPSINLDRRI